MIHKIKNNIENNTVGNTKEQLEENAQNMKNLQSQEKNADGAISLTEGQRLRNSLNEFKRTKGK